MNKYYPYLTIKHNYNDINCLTLIEEIYKKHLNISFIEKVWKDLDITQLNQRWFKKYGHLSNLEKGFIEDWNKISLMDIQEYDVLVFGNKLINHFGMYIEQNQFIHIFEEQYCTISELNQEWRDKLMGVYSHKNVVR